MKNKLKYISLDADRHGNTRIYFRRDGKKVRIKEPLGSSEFHKVYSDLLRGVEQAKSNKMLPYTLEWAVLKFYDSHTFKKLASSTQTVRRRILSKIISGKSGQARLIDITPQVIHQGMKRREATPIAANHFRDTMAKLMQFCVEEGWIYSNPAHGIPGFKSKAKSHEAWPQAYIEQYEAHWSLGTKQRLVFDILKYTGMRISDVRVLGRQHIKNGWIVLKQQKTKVLLEIPLPQEVQRSVDATQVGDMTWVLTNGQKPYSEKSIGQAFVKWAKAAGIPDGYTAHGLRHNIGVALAENDAGAAKIQAQLGHASMREADTYTKQVNKRKMAGEASKILKVSHRKGKVGQL